MSHKSVWAITFVAMATVATGAALTGCANGAGPAEGGGADSSQVTVGYASPIASDPDQQALALGMQKAAEQLNWKVRVVDANLSADKQVSDIDTLVGLDVGGIISFSLDPGALSAAYARAAAAKTPVVAFNSVDAEKQVVTASVSQERFLCPDGTSISQQMADYIDSRVPGAEILVIGPPPVASLTAMTDCFVQAAQASGLTIVDREDNTKATSDAAQQIVASMLTKNPDVGAIWTFNDTTAAGAGAALKQAGGKVWTGDGGAGVVIIGGGADETGIAAVKAGIFTVSYANNSFDAGVAAVKAIAESREGKLTEKDIIVPSKAWDSANVDEYVPDSERSVTAADVQ